MNKEYQVISSTFGQMKNPFIVPTPDPYIVDLAHAKDPEKAVADLTEHVGVLRKVLAMLDISEQEARQRHYTLNTHTYDELYYRAMTARNHEVCMFLQANRW